MLSHHVQFNGEVQRYKRSAAWACAHLISLTLPSLRPTLPPFPSTLGPPQPELLPHMFPILAKSKVKQA
eukprot:357682-Chlamydomonas_euryale.AAC.2